jgi:methylase of polypeptide subunit release factors
LATAVAARKRFFHYFLEFPEVCTASGGFDCILGNPPYLGGGKISTYFGKEYLN